MSERKHFSYAPERLGPDLFAIPLPLYDGSPVNSYISVDRTGGLWLIDGGLGSDEAQSTLRSGISTLGYDFDRDVRGLLVTHGHMDHVGAAQAILDKGGQLLAHRIETTEGREQAFDETWLQRHGLPVDGGPRAAPFRNVVWPEPTRLLEDGERLCWGSLDLQVVWCPGHTPGLICLYEPNRALLFTTDHVMRRAPAPVSVRQARHENPLADYLASVDKLRSTVVQTVLPGHGRPFHHLRQRLDQIQAEIQHQLDTILGHLRSGPASAYELLSLSALRDRRPIATRYEVSLVLARLRFLERLGRLREIDSPTTIRYALCETG